MAISAQARRQLAYALNDIGAANEVGDAIDAATVAGAANATVAGNKTFTGTNSHSGAETFTGGVTISTAGVTVTDVDIALSATTGTKIGTATGQKLAFFNSTPIVQRAAAAQTAVVGTASTQTTPWGFATQAQADAIVTLVNEMRAALTAFGLIKGSA